MDLRTGVVRSNLISNVRQSQKAGGEEALLPEGSLYQPAKATVEKALRQEAFDGQGMPSDKWAKAVVGDLLKTKPPSVVWRGENAWLTRIASIMPFGILDGPMKKLTGMDVVAKLVQGKPGGKE